jgi:RNA polymerase sigma-70 factor (ECF subfamily)
MIKSLVKTPITAISYLDVLQYLQMTKSVTELDDPQLLLNAGHGDQQAMSELYDRHAGKVYGMALRFVKQPDMAEDVVQEVFTDAWRAAERYRPELASVSTWLGTIAHNRAISRLRKESRKREIGDSDLLLEMQSDPNAKMPEPQNPELIAALKELPKERRELIVLAYYGGYTQSQIAKMLDLPLGTVKTRTHKALKQLRKTLMENINE